MILRKNLHRSGTRPQWEEEPEEGNIWQKTAALTHGVLTPGNLVTWTGVELTRRGLNNIERGRYVKGILQLVAGGVCDVGDGEFAEATKTKSPFGEANDAAADKFAIGWALRMLTRKKIVPKAAAVAIGAQNAANAALTVTGKALHREMHVGRSGKDTMALQRTAIGAYVVADFAERRGHHAIGRLARYAGHTATTAGTAVIGLQATADLYKQVFRPETAAEPQMEVALSPIVPAALTGEY
jgi:phosphatidylglycerophosphate synthase